MKSPDPALPAPRGIIIGHSNQDLDCLASLVLARYLFPDFIAVKSQRLHPLARSLFNLYGEGLGLKSLSDLDLGAIQEIIIVDTRSYNQVSEVLDKLPNFSGHVTVYDHHDAGDCLLADCAGALAAIKGSVKHRETLGANVSLMVRHIRQRGLTINPDDATIALAGLYADTGHFMHGNVQPEDFQAAAWLVAGGADINLVKKFVHTWHDQELNAVLHDLLGNLQTVELNGQVVLFAQSRVDHQAPGLAMVVERIFELEPAEAIFCVFNLVPEKSHLVIARSGGQDIDVAELLAHFGGGGHPGSASALLRKSNDIPVLENLKRMLQHRIQKPLGAQDMMSRDVHCVQSDWSLLQAAVFLEEHNHTGAPVVDENACLCGMLGLREIQKARKADAINAPVRAYMNRSGPRIQPQTSLREIENIFFNSDIGRLPVVQDGQVVGIISRSDLLAALKRSPLQAAAGN